MSWGARIKAAIHGDVDSADVRALLAAAAPLASLAQGLADRRLEAELAHLGQEWRVALDLSDTAAPLWLADALVILAGSLVDAEEEAHADAPGTMSAIAHRQALALLQPIDTIVAEASAALADPRRLTTLHLPVTIGPQSAAADQMVPSFPVSYLRGLLQGADRLEGAVHVALENLATLAGRSSAPDWLSDEIQRLRGELAAAQARLTLLRTRSASLFKQQQADNTALRQLDADQWSVINSYLRIGQLVTAPRLFPGAPSRSSGARAPAQPPVAPSTQSQSVPPPPPHLSSPPTPPAEQPHILPEIGPSWHVTGVRRATPQPAAPSGEDIAHPLPRIGPPTSSPSTSTGIARDLPKIGTVPPATGRVAPDLPRTEPRTPDKRDDVRPLPEIAGPATPAAPRSLDQAAARTPSGPAAARRVARPERWLLSSSGTRHRLRAAGEEERAERDLAAFWQARDWALSARDHAYLSEVTTLAGRGTVGISGRSLNTPPFAPIYRVLAKEVMLLGQRLAIDTLFSFDYIEGQLLKLASTDGVPD